MQLEPGPVAAWPAVEFDLRVEPAEFEAAALAALLPLDAHLVEIERRELELAEAVSLGQADELAEPVREATEALAMELELAAGDDLGEIAAAADDVDGLLLEAFEAAPDEAWYDLPEFFAPWRDEGGFVPEPPPGEIPLVPGEPLPPYTPPQAPVPTAKITNLTRYGAVDFWPGDEWLVEITGPPLQMVSIMVWQDGVPQGPLTLGVTDTLGRWSLRGSMSEYERGVWVEEWRVGGLVCSPVLTFVVR